MKLIFSCLADAANISSDNKFNLLGVFQNVFSSKMPTTLMQFSIALQARANKEERETPHTLKVIFRDKDNFEVKTFPEMPIELFQPENSPHADLILVVGVFNLDLPKFGEYRFDIVVDEQSIGQVPMQVIPIGDESKPQQPPT